MSAFAPIAALPALETDGILRPPFSPELETVRASAGLLRAEHFESIESLRAQPDSFTIAAFLTEFPDLMHKEYTIPAPPDNPSTSIILSVFTRKDSTCTQRPAVYNIHGGGQIAGTRFAGFPFIARWYAGMNAVLVTVEYRLAPEHPAPAALNDSYTGLVWVTDHAAELGVNPDKIMVQGISGGGPIAAACAIKARNEGYPRLCAQLLSTPMLDCRGETVSARQFESVGHWCGRTNRMAWGFVLGEGRDVKGEDISELISPSRATDLAGVAPAFIDAGEAEVFRDEAVRYAGVLWESGVSAELHVWPGCWHGFDMLAPEAKVSQAATAVKMDWIRRVLCG
ncbi:lipase [Aspergillus pseudoustus]|uniref:Lipase n=1 Tax=Aspergillus pseudoustus TaxID=1810923 RepID=A0ABR4JIS6_9EURO